MNLHSFPVFTKGMDYVRTTFYYLLEAGNIPDEEAFIALINQELSPELGEFTMTFAEHFRTKGRLEGRAEGRTEGRTEGRAEGWQAGQKKGKVEGFKEAKTHNSTESASN